MAKPVVGLNDINSWDPSLQTDDIDHDFFDDPTGSTGSTSLPLSPPSQAHQDFSSSSSNNPDILNLSERRNSFKNNIIGPATATINNTSNGSSKSDEILTNNYSNNIESNNVHSQIFSTGTLLACLNSPQTELKIDVSDCDSIPTTTEYYHRHHHHHRNYHGNLLEAKPNNNTTAQHSQHHHQQQQYLLKSHSNSKKSNQNQAGRIKLFDISDSSSDSSDESDEELNNFMEKYVDDFLEPGDSDFSDITEVSPMSSLTASPLPSSFLNGGNSNSNNGPTGDDGSNHSLSGVGGGISSINLFSLQQHQQQQQQQLNSLQSEQTTTESMPMILPTLQISNPVGDESSLSAIKPPSFTGLFDDLKEQNNDDDDDHHHHGEHSPSNSSLSCESTNNNTSSISFSLSSATSRSGSSASSSCSSSRKVARNHALRNHTFTPEQLKKIEKENGILLKKILDTQRHGGHHFFHASSRGKNGHHRNLQCSAAISRQKQLRRIDHENSLLMKRLQTAKPSKEIEVAFSVKNNANNS